MKDLKQIYKIAILRILKDIIYADGIVDKREVAMYEDVFAKFNLNPTAEKEVDSLNSLFALSYINEMSMENKEEFARMMGKMIVVDEDINYNEVKLYNLIIDFCHINKSESSDGHFKYTDIEELPSEYPDSF